MASQEAKDGEESGLEPKGQDHGDLETTSGSIIEEALINLEAVVSLVRELTTIT